MSRTFNIQKRFYDDFKLYNKTKMTFEPGLTILVGCNGTGKTTMIEHIKYVLEKDNIKFISFNNRTDGGRNSVSKALTNNASLAAALFVFSEGEQIHKNISYKAAEIGKFISRNGYEKELWFLFDAVDSGLSIDNIIDIKEHLFKRIIEDNPDKDIYVICSANSYEMAAGEKCFDVYNGKYRSFPTYKTYKKFILKSYEIKEKTILDEEK